MKFNFILGCVLWCVLSISCKEEGKAFLEGFSLRLDSLIESEHAQDRFDGTVIVGTMDTVLFEKAIGTSNRVWDIPMHMEHRFDICSLNKSFIAALILKASEEGKIALEDKLVNYLKDYDYSGTFNKDVTIHQVLTHTSGLPDYNQIDQDLSAHEFRIFKRKHFSNPEYVNFISSIPEVSIPGKKFYYSNFGYHLLAIILEDLYDRPFGEILNEKICDPINLNSTFSTMANRKIFNQVVEAYDYDQSSGAWNRNQFIDLSLGRRIFSNAYDLYLWGRAMSDTTILSKASIELMQTNHLKDITPEFSYGYGWVIFDGENDYRMGDLGIDEKYIIHGGTTEGYKSLLVNIENGKYIIVVLANTGNRSNEISLAKMIIQILKQ